MRPLAPLISVVILALGSCRAPVQHTGKRPYGRRRAPEYDAAKSLEQRMAERERADRAPREGEFVNAEEQVIGAPATHVYHRPSCKELDGLPRTEQIRFLSPYDAIDGGYDPCPICHPGP